MNLEACLPAELRGPATTITKIAAGLSGAGVYRVDADGRAFVLKISPENEPLEGWRRKLQILERAANAGVAPPLIHADEGRRAVLTTFVVDRSFLGMYGNPQTRDAAIGQLGDTLRRVHALPVPIGVEENSPQDFLAALWTGPLANAALPSFAKDAVERVRSEPVPPRERASGLSHNDVNPSNLVYDGTNIVLLDWDTAGLNDPLFDLATIAVFFRMDEPTILKLLTAHDGEPVSAMSPRFSYFRRVVAVMCGSAGLNLAHASGYAGDATEMRDATLSLGDVYQGMRSGALRLSTPEGQWKFGLALLKESVAL